MLPSVHPSRIVWIAIAALLFLHLLLGVGQSQGWFPGEGRWLGIGAVRREWRVESALGSIERFRTFGVRWLDEAAVLPMSHEEFLNQHSRAFGGIFQSLHPDVRRNPDRDAEQRWIASPAFEAPYRRYDAANERFNRAVAEFYGKSSRGSLIEPRGAWNEMEKALDDLRRAVESSR